MIGPDFYKQDTLPARDTRKAIQVPLPEKIGPYKIESLLERGGMSLLYLAVHPETKEPITIKVLFPEYMTNPEMVQRFIREAEIIALADHPNIVKLFGHGKWENGLYIAMEYVNGISLRQYLLRNLISLKRALEIVMEISMALCHLHAHGIIHRDLKPENILISESGAIKVIDFGIAQMLTDVRDSSSEKRLIGTPIYMSPEQRDNPESTSYPSDIYSLGIITYELVLGKLSHGQIHLGIMPRGLQKILSKALQQKPDNRYQDIVDFMTELSDYLNSSAMLKENKEIAPLSDLSESLRQAERSLVPSTPPFWKGIETGMATYRNIGSGYLYYDYFTLPNQGYGIVVGEPSVKGSPAIVYASTLRGMIRALSHLTHSPSELTTALNELLINDSMKQTFTFSCLLLSQDKNHLSFISCQCGSLFLIPAGTSDPIPIEAQDNPPLGLETGLHFTDLTHPWNRGDGLIFYASLHHPALLEGKLFSKEQLQASLEEASSKEPQAQVDSIFRKIKIEIGKSHDDHSIVIFNLFREM